MVLRFRQLVSAAGTGPVDSLHLLHLIVAEAEIGFHALHHFFASRPTLEKRAAREIEMACNPSSQ
jgi:hypothetical protein